MNHFDEAIKYLLQVEGGFVNNPLDSGGPTCWGVTARQLSLFRNRPVTEADIANLGADEATRLYKALYWDTMKLTLINDRRIALVLFDQAVNRGVYSAAFQAQTVLNALGAQVSTDGILGMKTAQVLNLVDPESFSLRYIQASQLFYAGLCVKNPSQLLFLRGWLARTHTLERAVLFG